MMTGAMQRQASGSRTPDFVTAVGAHHGPGPSYFDADAIGAGIMTPKGMGTVPLVDLYDKLRVAQAARDDEEHYAGPMKIAMPMSMPPSAPPGLALRGAYAYGEPGGAKTARPQQSQGQPGSAAAGVPVFPFELCPYGRLRQHRMAPGKQRVVSLGTVGHPTTCAEACMDASCADAACRKCHLCGEKEEEAEATPDSSDFSVGSLGHPHTCAEACKYHFKKKACKDGSMCTRCHFCRWSRYSAAHKNKNKTTQRA